MDIFTSDGCFMFSKLSVSPLILKNPILLILIVTIVLLSQRSWADDPQGLQLYGRIHTGIPLAAETNIPGESIDARKGQLKLNVLDIVIPGNGGLDIELYREFMPDERIERGMEDWNISLPRITMSTNPGGTTKFDLTKDHAESSPGICADDDHNAVVRYTNFGFLWAALNQLGDVDIPLLLFQLLWAMLQIFVGFEVPVEDTYTGLNLYIPGEGVKPLLRNVDETPMFQEKKRFASGKAVSSRYVTVDNWLVDCENDAKGKSNNFVAYSPQGKKYTFDVLSKSLGDPVLLKQIGQYVWYPSEVKDRFGNTLSYSYVKDSYICLGWLEYIAAINDPRTIRFTTAPVCPYSNKLKSIRASDGRQLTVNYERPASLVDPDDRTIHDHFGRRVVSIEAHGREWKYHYKKWTTGFSNYLQKVELPDGTTWEYEKHDRDVGGVPFTGNDWARNLAYSRVSGLNIFGPDDARVVGEDGSISNPSIIARVLGLMKTVKTPLGLNIEYDYKTHDAAFFEDTTSTLNKVYSVSSRAVSGPDVEAATTTYDYSKNSNLDEGYTDINYPPASNGDTSRKRTVFELSSGVDHFGLPKREESYVQEALESSRDIEFISLARVGVLGAIKEAPEALNVIRAVGKTSEVTLDGNKYETSFEEFDSFGNPLLIEESGSNYRNYIDSDGGQVTTPSRTTELTYFNNVEDWILGLPKNETTLNNGGGSGNVAKQRTFFDNGMLKSFTENRGTRTYTYHNSGDLKSVGWKTSGKNHVKTFTNYYRGVAESESHPENISIERDVNDWGEIRSVVNGRGVKLTFLRDSLGRVKSVQQPGFSDLVTEWNYGGNPRHRLEKNAKFRTLVKQDAAGNTISTEKTDLVTGRTIYEQSSFDSYSKRTFQSEVSYSPNPISGVSYQYDSFGRLVYEEDQRGNIIRTCYSIECIPSGAPYEGWDLSGYLTKVVTTELPAGGDESGSLSQNVVDFSLSVAFGNSRSQQLVGQFTKENESFNQNRYSATLYKRTKLGDAIEIAKGGASVSDRTKRVYQYYPNSNQVRFDDSPDLGRTELAYDDSGNVSQKIVENKVEVKFTYDSENRILYEDYPNTDGTPDVSHAYDANGNLRWVDNGYSRVSYNYNAADQIDDVTYLVGGISYKFDYVFNPDKALESLAFPDGENITFKPQGNGVPQSVGKYARNVLYHATGHIKSFAYGNDTTYDLSLNDYNIPSKYGVKLNAGGYLVQESYSHNFRKQVYAIDRQLGFNSPEVSESYRYSPRNYLIAGNNTLGPVSYSYDALGNMSSKQENGITYTMTHSGLESNSLGTRLATVSSGSLGSKTYEYDVLGNVTTNGRNAFTYDKASRMTSVNDLGIKYYYDGRGYRIAEVSADETKLTLRGERGQVLYQHNIKAKQVYKYYHLGSMLIAEDVSSCAVNCQKSPNFVARTVDADRTVQSADVYIKQKSVQEIDGKVYYQFEIGNNGPSSAENVMLSHALSKGSIANYSISVGQCSSSQQPLVCQLGELKPGEAVLFDASTSDLTLVDFGGGLEASVSSSTDDPNSVNNTISADDLAGAVCPTEQATAGTAAAEYLYVLRNYRDEVLASSTFGHTIIDSYYSLSPSIVKSVSENEIYLHYSRLVTLILFLVALVGLSPLQLLAMVPILLFAKFIYRRWSISKVSLLGKVIFASAFSLAFASVAHSQVTYLHSNPMGSIVAATNEQGQQVWVKDYTPYGIESQTGEAAGSGINRGFATHELDRESGLVYMKARYYDPVVGRFYSRDPIEADYNYFSYSINNPINFVDVDGKEAIRLELSAGILGVNFTGGLFITYPTPTGFGSDRFDIGLYHTSNPLSSPASFVYNIFDPHNPIANSAISFGTAKLTFGLGWDESRASMDGYNPTLFGGGGPGGLGSGMAASWSPERIDGSLAGYMPSGFDVNYGLQGLPWLPLNGGYQVDYTFSYSMGDFMIDYAFPAIDSVTEKLFSDQSGSSDFEY